MNTILVREGCPPFGFSKEQQVQGLAQAGSFYNMRNTENILHFYVKSS